MSAIVESTAAEFYATAMDAILKVGERFPTVSKEYQEFFDKATRDVEFYYPTVFSGRMTLNQALRQLEDNFEDYLDYGFQSKSDDDDGYIEIPY